MRFSIAASAILIAGATAWDTTHDYYPTTKVTSVVYPAKTTTVYSTEYTTYCPSPTVVVYGTSTISVTEATTLVVTDYVTYTQECTECVPETVTYTTTEAPTPPPPITETTTETPPPPPPTTLLPNSTIVVVPTLTPTESEAPIFTGAASHAVAGAGAGLAALLGLVAYLL